MTGSKPKAPVAAGTGQPPAKEEDIDAFLAQVRAMPPPATSAGIRGRLIFAMDATMSRQPTWDRALQIQSEMFMETEKIGGLDVQLVYFRGFNECQASKWVSAPAALARLMTGVECRGGNTQIGRVMAHIKREAAKAKVNAVVYVGDAMEEGIDRLCAKAGELGLLGIPMFMFQEGSDGATGHAYREIARLTGGAYLRLNSASAHALRELLSAVAVYAAGGRPALESRAKSQGGGATLLLAQLKQGSC